MAEEAMPASDSAIVEDAPQQESAEIEQQESVDAAPAIPDYKSSKHKVKVDDQELEIDYDDLIKGYQTNSAGQKRLREAAEIRQKVDGVIGALQSGDHNKLIGLLGKQEAIKLANDLLVEQIEYEELPEHEKTIRQLTKEKEEAERILKEQEAERTTAREKQENLEAAQKLESEIVGVIQESGVKPTKRIIARMAEIMEAHYLQTSQPLSAVKAFEYVVEDQHKDFIDYAGGLSKDQIKALKKQLPKSLLDVFREDDVDQILSQASLGQGRAEVERLPTKKEKPKRMSSDAWFAQMEKKLSGG